jgi:hypothetical protein
MSRWTTPHRIAGFVLLATGASCLGAPTESALVERFETHAREFGRLADLVAQYPTLPDLSENSAVSAEATRLGVPENRVTEFASLRTGIGYDRKLSGGVYGIGVLSLVVYDATGMAGQNHLLGYVLSPTSPNPTFPSLRAWDEKATHADTAFRHLSGQWFVFEIRQ